MIQAVDDCSRKVTVGDEASNADVKLSDAQKALHALAADTMASWRHYL